MNSWEKAIAELRTIQRWVDAVFHLALPFLVVVFLNLVGPISDNSWVNALWGCSVGFATWPIWSLLGAFHRRNTRIITDTQQARIEQQWWRSLNTGGRL